MKYSSSIKNLFTAVLKAQAEFPVIARESDNPFFKKKYAALDAIQEAIHHIMHKHGLVYSQHPENVNELTTLVVHAESGEWMESTYQMTPTKAGPQETGSLISYQKRYALQAIMGVVVSGEDDDGNKAQGKERDGQRQAIPQESLNSSVSEQERSRIIKELNKYENVDEMRKYFKGLKDVLRNDEKIIAASKERAEKLVKQQEVDAKSTDKK